MKHLTKIPYPEGHKKLVEDIGNLRYDSLAELLDEISQKILNDSQADFARKRPQLAMSLYNASVAIRKAGIHINESWKISKPFMTVDIIKDLVEIEKFDGSDLSKEEQDQILNYLEEKRPELHKKWMLDVAKTYMQ